MTLRYSLSPGAQLILSHGDLTQWEGDAIVNAANEAMLGGGGVDGAIHAAAGPELLRACEAVPEVRTGVRCPTGEARITPAFGRLRVGHVIHTVGPVYRDAKTSGPLLAAAYRNSLQLANQNGLSSVAFPAISCGVFLYPLEEAASIAIDAVRAHCGELKQVAFVFFSHSPADAWTSAADRAGLTLIP